MKRKIVITGGAGFIGTHLAERLLPTSRLVLFDNLRRNSLDSAPSLRQSPDVELVQGDIMDKPALCRAMDGAEAVFHLAAIAGVSSYYNEPLDTLKVNLFGAVNVIEAAVQAKITHLVAFSTSEVFGSDALWVDETQPYCIGNASDKRWVYATSKMAVEQFVRRYGEAHGMTYTIIRPFNIYGGRQTGEGAISNFCRAALRKTPLLVYGDGSPLRAWCYIADFVDVVATLPGRPEAVNQDFNIGNPAEVVTTLALARAVAAMVPGSRVELRKSDRAEVKARVPAIAKARRMLGFEPKVGLEEGLTKTLEWFKNQGVS
jgi:UDP-glucose 4-epimerase